MAYVQEGHVKIDGKPYRIDPNSYDVVDIVDFAPRAATPGGSIIHSELGLYQPLVITDWRHGFGFPWHTDPSGWKKTAGNIDTRHEGIVTLFTNRVLSDSHAQAKEGFVTFNNAVYSYGNGGVRKFTASWADEGGYGVVNHLLPTGSYLFIARDGARIRKMDTSSVHTDAGLDANATDYKWLIVYNGFIYAGKDGTNRVHYSDKEDLSDLEGTASDPDVIYVGAGGIPTIGAIVFAGKMYISRQDGLWVLDQAARLATKMLDFSDQISNTNFRSMAVHNGNLIFPIRDRIYQWNGARLSDITPAKINDAFPYVTYGRFDNFVTVGRFLFLSARTSESSYKEDLLAWDGVGWHRLAELEVSTGETRAMGYDVVNNRLWYHTSNPQETYFIRFQDLSEYPYADFPTTGSHQLETSRLDMGFRWVQKSSPNIVVEASNMTANRTIQVHYSLDGGAFTLLGTVTANGQTELNFTGGSVQFYNMTLRFTLATNDATQSPVLEGVTVRFIMRPEVTYGYTMEIIEAEHVEHDGTIIPYSSKQMIDNLRTARNSKAPITFVDLRGVSRTCYVSQLREHLVEEMLVNDQSASADSGSFEFRTLVTLVELN